MTERLRAESIGGFRRKLMMRLPADRKRLSCWFVIGKNAVHFVSEGSELNASAWFRRFAERAIAGVLVLALLGIIQLIEWLSTR